MSEEAMNRDPHDPNKGLNVRAFLTYVFIALVVILGSALITLRVNKNKEIPHATMPRPASATSPQ